ncbi:hypothetical protein BMF94_0279 [Rhodotorula taiwanensis]|uniref:DNA-directed RNA polymerase III subunit n=1 Tax=Rhodotorula taiwanensis TaxID=741276 RepID=A0A2S5BIT8_9BASI|nr:hypothetical protein BMF94_0279 [Rhodotorula taiwanensis]
MASRGGRGGGRGGRGGASGKPQPPMGHLQYAEIIEQSKQGTDVLYPPMDLPETEYPSEREARIAKRHNEMVNEMKFTPFWIDPPMRATTEIERWSDQFKPKTASAATAVAALRTVHDARQYDKDLLPPSAFEAIFEKKPKGKATSKGKSAICCAWSDRKLGTAGGILEGDDDVAEDEEEEEEPDDAEGLDEEEEDEGDNDYEMDYFDNGEEDDFDNLGGGAGGGDDDGGIMD